MAPGSLAADATEVYQEGLRLPPVKIINQGAYNHDIWKIILSNHRTPDTSWGDYHAMIGSLHIAERRLHELLATYGGPVLARAAAELLDYSERFMRAEIREIPNGIYCAEDCMEDDGVSDRPYYFRLKLVVRDERSNNGTYVDGARIPAHVWTPVGASSRLRFGPVEFTVRLS